MDIFDRIQDLIDKKGITAYKLSQDTGISTGLISQWKKRSQKPSGTKLQKAAEYFNVSVDYLLGNENKAPTERQEPSKDDIKFALFNGDKEISDAAYDEVKAFAEFIQQKYKKEK